MLNPEAKLLRSILHGVCIGIVVYLIGLALILNALENLALGSSGGYKIHLLQILGLLIGVGAIIAIYNSVKSWKDPEQWRWYKIWNTALAVSCVGFFWFIYHWHLLNFHLRY
jgi:xanthine/uracil permease